MLNYLKNNVKSFINQLFTRYQLVLGWLLIVPFSAFLLWGTEVYGWVSEKTRLDSLVLVSFIYYFSYVSFKKFSGHLSSINISYVPLLLLTWTGLLILPLFILRIPYSITYLVLALTICLIYLLAVGTAQNHRDNKRVGFILQGQAKLPKAYEYFDWIVLSSPNQEQLKQLDLIVADLSFDFDSEWSHLITQAPLKTIPVYHYAKFEELLTGKVCTVNFYDSNLGEVALPKHYQVIKRYLDIILTLSILPLFGVVSLFAFIAIKLESKGSAIFKQVRVGQGGKLFTLYKFRSMSTDSEESGAQFAKQNDTRVTKVGRFIRKTRVDELPQLINVLKGDMSLIGPRPEQESFVKTFEKEIPFYGYRHIVKPGISGWAQVMQGYVADQEDTKIKLQYDLYYIKRFSFSLDFLVFFKTIYTLLTGFGAR